VPESVARAPTSNHVRGIGSSMRHLSDFFFPRFSPAPRRETKFSSIISLVDENQKRDKAR
jgi:hypothetical protein